MEIQAIGPDKFKEYNDYLMYLATVIDVITEPTSIKLNGQEFVLAKEGDAIAVVRHNGEGLESYATFLDGDGSLHTYFDEYFMYQFFRNQENRLVTRKSLTTEFNDQVYVRPREDNSPHDYLNYYIKTPEGDMELQIIYDVTRFIDNLELFFTYIDSKLPESFFLNKIRHIIGKLDHVKHEWFMQVGDEDDYGKIIMNLPFNFTPVGATSYTAKDIRDYLLSIGMPGEIPQDMRDMFLGRDKTVKTLELLANQYRKYHGI